MVFSSEALLPGGASDDGNGTGAFAPWNCVGCRGLCLHFPVLLSPGQLCAVQPPQEMMRELRQVLPRPWQSFLSTSHIMQEMLKSQQNRKLHAKTPVSFFLLLLCIFGIYSGSGWIPLSLVTSFVPVFLMHSDICEGTIQCGHFPFSPCNAHCHTAVGDWCPISGGLVALWLRPSGSPCWKTWFVTALCIIISYYCYYQGRNPNYFRGFFGMCNLNPGRMWKANSSGTGPEIWLGQAV